MKIMNPFATFARMTVLVGGSVLAVGSSGTVKPRPTPTQENAAVVASSCGSELPRDLEDRVQRLMNACRTAGGTPSHAYTMRDDPSCPSGTMLHGARVTCDGATIDESAAESDDARTSPREEGARAVSPVNASTDVFIRAILTAHNKYRAELGLPGLQWSDELARHAAVWARYLVDIGGRKLVHDVDTKYGENLWMGTARAYPTEKMVDGWGSEKSDFIYATFPNVSRTGQWKDVGHYTQIIWHSTTHVGCATANAGGNDILVCRYSPAGNILGRKPY